MELLFGKIFVLTVCLLPVAHGFLQPFSKVAMNRFQNVTKITTADQYLGEKDRPYAISPKPNSAFLLGANNFLKELGGIGNTVLMQLVKSDQKVLPEILGLELSNEMVAKAEKDREETGGRVDAHPVSRLLYDVGCQFLDRFFDERAIARFWFLETVARMPYFAYVSMLHLYETLGWWRIPQLRKVHNAEEWNELHHLLIMESLGGDKFWSDRFLGYHCAIVYYWALVAVYLFSPAIAYEFMELLEAHAVDTYGTFLKQNEEKLKSLPAPDVAVTYYTGADLYEFDEFQVSRAPGTRRPPCNTLYDVFKNIKEDEAEHVRTMQACQDYSKVGKTVVSPHLRMSIDDNSKPSKKKPLPTADKTIPDEPLGKDVDLKDTLKADSREEWVAWSNAINEDAKKVDE